MEREDENEKTLQKICELVRTIQNGDIEIKIQNGLIVWVYDGRGRKPREM